MSDHLHRVRKLPAGSRITLRKAETPVVFKQEHASAITIMNASGHPRNPKIAASSAAPLIESPRVTPEPLGASLIREGKTGSRIERNQGFHH